MTTEEIAVTLTNHENRIKVSEHRIKDMEEAQKQIYELTISVKELAISVKSMVQEQKEQGERIDRLERVPAKKWQLVSKTITTAVLSAIGGAIGAGILVLLTIYV